MRSKKSTLPQKDRPASEAEPPCAAHLDAGVTEARDSFDALAATLCTPKGMAMMGLLPESAAARSMLDAGAHQGLDELDIMGRLLKESGQPEAQRIGSWERLAETQAKTLDCLFHRLVALGFSNIKNVHFHPLLKLAFRAQAQSARTLETLAALRQPTVFAKQVNIGQQQVVANGVAYQGEGGAPESGQGASAPPTSGRQPPELRADGARVDELASLNLTKISK